MDADTNWIPGMTIRDYFAAKAMQGFISNNNALSGIKSAASANKSKIAPWIADMAYEMADAMIEQRNKE